MQRESNRQKEKEQKEQFENRAYLSYLIPKIHILLLKIHIK